jgi:hypothetical protein
VNQAGYIVLSDAQGFGLGPVVRARRSATFKSAGDMEIDTVLVVRI